MAPWIAEWKGNVPYGQDPMLMFLGRRGQVCYLDPFLNTKGNFNVAVAAASGAGKSFFTQDYVKAILGSGGKAFIIDSGRSYENLCKILDGEYIDFEEGNTICLKIFANNRHHRSNQEVRARQSNEDGDRPRQSNCYS